MVDRSFSPYVLLTNSLILADFFSPGECDDENSRLLSKFGLEGATVCKTVRPALLAKQLTPAGCPLKLPQRIGFSVILVF